MQHQLTAERREGGRHALERHEVEQGEADAQEVIDTMMIEKNWLDHFVPAEQLAAKSRLASKGQLLLPDTPSDTDAVVCVSLPVFEETKWIDALLDNFKYFAHPTTKIALHFDGFEDYDNETMARFESKSVAVTKERVQVHKIGGSILYSHLLNAKTLEERWPGTCKFFVMQSSNMMWVRRGMERAVRQHRYAQLFVQENSLAAASGPFWQLLERKGMHGWGQPEGAFFPMKTVTDFTKYMEDWLKQTNQDMEVILRLRVYLEAFWMQTYALNFATDIPPTSVGGDFSVCYRHLMERNRNYDRDSVPLNEIKDIIEGKERIHNEIDHIDPRAAQYYAVKRVNRDMTHPTTRFLMNLVPKDERLSSKIGVKGKGDDGLSGKGKAKGKENDGLSSKGKSKGKGLAH